MTVKLTEIENAVYRLAMNIKKTQKRANALENITIPLYDKLSKDIQNALEEKEREEHTRLKIIKRTKENRDNRQKKLLYTVAFLCEKCIIFLIFICTVCYNIVEYEEVELWQ